MSIQLVDGRTALLIPFHLPEGMSRRRWAAGLLSRRQPVDSTGKPDAPMWHVSHDRPVEVLDLLPEFRDALLSTQWDGGAQGDDPGKGSICLKLDEEFVERYAACEVVTNNSEHELSLSGAEVFVHSHGVGVLVLRVDYGSHGDPRVAIRTLIAARHLHSEGGVRGWVFKKHHGALPQGQVAAGSSDWLDTMAGFSGELRAAMHDAVQTGEPLEPVRLGSFANWLLLVDGEAPEQLDPVVHGEAVRAGRALPPQSRIDLTRFAKHQSAFVLEGEPTPEVQTRLLFHLARAYKDDYLVPPEADEVDVVLRPRRNRVIGVTREGAASISWLEPGANEVLEVYQWPAKFLDFYLALHVHVLGERKALSESAYQLARGAEELGLLRLEPGAAGRVAERHGELMKRVSTTFLRATGADTGGSSEYQNFYRGLRQVHESRRVLEEVRQRLADLDVFGGEQAVAAGPVVQETLLEALALDREERRREREELRAEAPQVVAADGSESDPVLGKAVALAGFFLIIFSSLHVLEMVFPTYMRSVTADPILGFSTLFVLGYLAWCVTRAVLPRVGRVARKTLDVQGAD